MTDNELLLAISNMIEPVRNDIRELKNGLQTVKNDVEDLKNRVKRIELNQENNMIPRLQNIEACYVSTYDRYKISVEDYEAMRQDISILKKVVKEHSEKLQKIS